MTRGAKLKQTVADTLQDWVFLALMGFGIKMLPTEFFGGVFLAMAASMVARKATKDDRKTWLVLFSAAVLAVFVAGVLSYARSPNVGYIAEDFPIQLAMTFSGFISRYVIDTTLSVMSRVSSRSGLIADRLIDTALPSNKKDNDDE
jgi:cell division protein FtsW (lipid II flippase)